MSWCIFLISCFFVFSVGHFESPIDGNVRNVVIGMASYPRGMLKLFRRLVGSLRLSGYQGEIILGIHPNISIEEVTFLRKMNVTCHPVEFVNCLSIADQIKTHEAPLHPTNIRRRCIRGLESLNAEWGRYELARQWLMDCKHCNGWALLIDTRDILFQADPFHALKAMKLDSSIDMVLIEEISPYSSPVNDSARSFVAGNPRSRQHVVPCYGFDTFVHYSNKSVLCSGTIFGSRTGMLRFLERLVEEFRRNSGVMSRKKCRAPYTTDQWTMNWLYYNHQFSANNSGFVTIPWGEGPVNTVGKPCMTRDRKTGAADLVEVGWVRAGNTDARNSFKARNEGLAPSRIGLAAELLSQNASVQRDPGREQSVVPRIVNNKDGVISAIVHQFDRCGKWMETFFALNQVLLRDPL